MLNSRTAVQQQLKGSVVAARLGPFSSATRASLSTPTPQRGVRRVHSAHDRQLFADGADREPQTRRCAVATADAGKQLCPS